MSTALDRFLAAPEIVRQQLGIFEALRKLGFPSEEIFVSWNDGHPLTVLRHNDRDFRIDYANCKVPADKETYEAAWTAAAEAWNSEIDDSVRDAVFKTWLHSGKSTSLVVALMDAGLLPPATADA